VSTITCGTEGGPLPGPGPTLTKLEVIGVAELVHQPLAPLRLLHDPLLVVLTQRAGQLVVVHGRTVLSLAPECGHLD